MSGHTTDKWKRKDFDDWHAEGPGSFTYRTIGVDGRDYPIAIVIQKDRQIYRDGDAELDANEARILSIPAPETAAELERANARIVELVGALAAMMEGMEEPNERGVWGCRVIPSHQACSMAAAALAKHARAETSQ